MALNDNIKNRLKTAAEADIDRYINGLKLSDADKQGVKTAYGNMLNGILDGSITLDGRTFNDEQGRYKNLTDGTDTYGLAANYLYRYRSLLNEDSQSKKDSKDSSKSTSRWADFKKLGKALTQALFYDITFDSNAFVGLDSQSYDPSTKKMGNSARLSRTLSAALDIYDNPDDYFSDLSDSQRQNLLSQLGKGIDILRESQNNNGQLTPDQSFDLKRIFQGLDLPSLLGTDYKPTTGGNYTGSSTPEQFQFDLNDFLDWANDNYKPSNSQKISFTVKSDKNVLNEINKNPNLQDNSTAILANSLKRQSYNYFFSTSASKTDKEGYIMGIGTYLQYLKDINSPILKPLNDNGVYLIDPEGTSIKDGDLSFVWDSKTNQITEMDDYDLLQYPVGLQEALRQYYDINGAIDQYNRAMLAQQIKDNMPQTAQKKKGGVLKAKDGINVPKLSSLPDFTYTGDKNAIWRENLSAGDVNSWLEKWRKTGDFGKPYASTTAGNNDTRYTPTDNKVGKEVEDIEKQAYYDWFSNPNNNILFDDKGNPTDQGIAWMKAVDKLLPEQNKSTFYNESGELRKSWNPTGIDARGKNTNREFNTAKEYADYLMHDQTLGARHNVLVRTGTRYYYTGSDGKIHYVDPAIANKYELDKEHATRNFEDNTFWTDIELKDRPDTDNPAEPASNPAGDATQAEGDKNNPSQVKTTGSLVVRTEPIIDVEKYQQDGLKYLPYAGEAVKLLFALRSNNINSRKLQAGVRPVLQDTYERFSPITGDFNALSTAGSNAAETLRRAALPFTSDASLQLAAQYDANRQAITTRLQGSRLNDQAIRQSQKEALARTEDNMARRTAVANNNRQAIQTARWTKAQIDAARRNNNTQSILNYMNDNLTRLRTSIDTKNQQGKAFQYNLAEQQIDNRYADEIADWRAKLAQMRAEGKSIVGTPEYNRYLGFMQRIQQWRANQKLMAYANIYGYNYRDYGTTPSISAIQAGWGADV